MTTFFLDKDKYCINSPKASSFAVKNALPKSPTSTIFTRKFLPFNDPLRWLPCWVRGHTGVTRTIWKKPPSAPTTGQDVCFKLMRRCDSKMVIWCMMICSFLRIRFSEINQSPGFPFWQQKKGHNKRCLGFEGCWGKSGRILWDGWELGAWCFSAISLFSEN